MQEEADTIVVNTGKVSARLARGRRTWEGGIDAAKAPAPLQAVRGVDGVWRGAGRLAARVKVLSMTAQTVQRGPIFIEHQVAYRFANGSRYTITFHFEPNGAYFLAREDSDGIDGGYFEFSLYPNYQPDQGFAIHRSLRPSPPTYTGARTLGRITNYMHVSSFGFTVASTKAGVNDSIAVFATNRGSWVDRRYQVETWFPLRADSDGQMRTSFRNYYGSPHSQISAQQRGGDDDAPDLFYRFPLHDGTREWGMAVYHKEWNEKELPGYPSYLDLKGAFIREMHVKVGDMTLDKFKDYILEWEPKPVTRPVASYRLSDLPRIRANLKEPFFKGLWDQGEASVGFVQRSYIFRPFWSFATADPRPAWGDPSRNWYTKRGFRDTVWAWVLGTFRGYDLGGSIYNQVEVRLLMDVCEAYDLLEPTGMFSPDELAELRAGLAVLAYRFNDPVFMPYQFNPGQQDFDAARTSAVLAAARAIQDHPEAPKWLDQCVRRVQDLLFVWQMPGGKWPENPPCYYQQSFCNFTYVAHQASLAGRDDLLRSSDFHEFVRWTLLLLTPPRPSDTAIMRNGLPEGKTYADIVKTRHIPGVGDHGSVGGVELKYDAALVAKLLRKHAPDLAAEMMWAFNRSGKLAVTERNVLPRGGGTHISQKILMARLSSDEMKIEKQPALDSRRLPSFGAVMRADAGTPDESCVLFRCGSSGVRYGRADNLLLYTARGVPLLIDGGDNSENSAMLRANGRSFGAGIITKFVSTDRFDYTVGEAPRYGREVRQHLLFMKNRYLLVSHELDSEAGRWRLAVLADRAEQRSVGGRPIADVFFTGRLGTDLAVAFAGDAEGLEQQMSDGSIRPGNIALKVLTVKIPEAGEIRALLLPTRKGEKNPAQVDAFGPGFRVRSGAETDIVFAGRRTAFYDQGIRFAGTCGIITWRDDGLRLDLVDGTRLEADGVSLGASGQAKASLWRRNDGVLVGEVEGSAVTILIGSPLLNGPLSLTVDGKPAAPRLLDGRLIMLMPAGKHTFEIRAGR